MKTTTAGILAAALLLASCTGGGSAAKPTASTPSASASSPSPTPSATSPSPTSAEDQAVQNAEAVYRDYLRAQTTCLSEPRKTLPTCFDNVAIGDLRTFESELYTYLETRAPGIFQGIVAKKQLDDEIKAALTAAVKEFAAEFAARKSAVA